MTDDGTAAWREGRVGVTVGKNGSIRVANVAQLRNGEGRFSNVRNLDGN